MRRVDLAGFLGVLALGAVLTGCDRGAEGRGKGAGTPAEEAEVVPTRPSPGGVTPRMVSQGKKLFDATCVVCHGPKGEGTQLGPDLRDNEWLIGSGEFPEIEQVIIEGVSEPEEHPIPMPPLGGGAYTREEVRALAAYVHAISQAP